MAAPLIFDRPLLRRRLQRRAPDVIFPRVVEEMLDRLAVVTRRFERPADVGSPGPGLATALAERDRPVTRVAPHPEPGCAGVLTCVGDEERLPLAPASHDLIVSALALGACNDLPGALVQIRRALRPDGFFLAACLGAGTLRELRTAFGVAESEVLGGVSPRVAPFVEVRDGGALLQRAGFTMPVSDTDMLTLRYADMFGLLADLRAWGAVNPLLARTKRFTSRRVFARAAAVYAERFADPDGRVRASVEVLFLAGWSPHESQPRALKPGSAQMKLAAALRSV